MTTKGLRHITIRENAIRESVDNKFIRVLHIEGKTNIADIFTKEMKDILHFCTLRDLLVSQKYSPDPLEDICIEASPVSPFHSVD
jgi:hypothetical protein